MGKYSGSLKIFARLVLLAALVLTTTMFVAPTADAQSDSQYLLPELLDADNATGVPCPAGTSVLYAFEFPDSDRALRYCTAPDGWVPITTEAECMAANAGARNGLDGETLTGRGFWFEATGLCFGGGNAAPVAEGGLDKDADCPDLPAEFFFEDIINPGPGTLFDYCIIPMYKQAPSIATPLGGVATLTTSAGTLSGFQATSADDAPSSPIDGVPASEALPHGLFEFTVSDLDPGATVTITLDLPTGVAPAPTSYWKIHDGTWFSLPSAAFNGDSVTFTLTDGGLGDADGEANGTIVDPGGPVVAAAQASTGSAVFEQGLSACITSDLVQNDPLAAGLGIGDRFRATDTGVLYQVVGGVSDCELNCADGFDANCDGQLGDVCPAEYDVSRVQGAAGCMAFLASTSQPAAEASAAPVTAAVAAPVGELAHTGSEHLLGQVGLALTGLGASTLAMRGALRRRKKK